MIADKKILAIFNMYDAEGIADEYVFYLLDAMNSYVDDLVIVCNGILRDEFYERFSIYTDDILIRKNIGYDSGAYKDVLVNFIGWEKVCEYDSLIFFNNTFFGPIYPFDKMFNEMQNKNLDFWGITKQKPLNKGAWGYIIEHLQAYFLFVNSRLLHNNDFKKFWKEQNGAIDNYKDAVFQFELRFTQWFSQRGYRWDSYIDYPFYMECNDIKKNFTQIYHVNYQFIKEKHCPVLKRKVFSFINIDYDMNEDVKLVLQYITQYTEYDINLIWNNILRTQDMAEVQQVLHLNFVIPNNKNVPCFEKIENAIVFFFIGNLHEWDSARLKTLKKIAANITICICILDDFINNEQYNIIKDFLPECHIKYFGSDKNRYIEKYIGLVHKEFGCCKYIGIVHDYNYEKYDNMLVSFSYLKKVLHILSEDKRIDFLAAYIRQRDKYVMLSETAVSLTYDLWCRRDFFVSLLSDDVECSFVEILKKRKRCFGIIQTTAYAVDYMMEKWKKVESELKTTSPNKDIDCISDLKLELVLANVKKVRQRFSRLYIYGKGYFGKKFSQLMEREQIEYTGFIVSQKEQDDVLLYGHKIYEVAEIDFEASIGIVLAIQDPAVKKMIKELLTAKKFGSENLFVAI